MDEQKEVKELLIEVSGRHVLKIPRSCRKGDHREVAITSQVDEMFAYCTRCGLRSHTIDHISGAWGSDLLIAAMNAGTAFRDPTNLRFTYSYKHEKGRYKQTEAKLHYVYDSDGHWKHVKAAMEGNTVWCRNGDVAREAIPCDLVMCKNKVCLEDIFDGIKKCGRHQITEGQNRNWDTARHINVL